LFVDGVEPLEPQDPCDARRWWFCGGLDFLQKASNSIPGR
jgi:hypothetical protein